MVEYTAPIREVGAQDGEDDAAAEGANRNAGYAAQEAGMGVVGQGAAADSQAVPSADQAIASALPPWSEHAKVVVPCYIKAAGLSRETLYLGVETTTVRPLAVFANGRVRQVIRFDSVAVGQTLMLSMRVRSNTVHPLLFTCETLNPTGPFSVLNSLPTLPPHGTREISVVFTPKAQCWSEEELVLRIAGCSLKASLQGHGVAPSLKLGDADDGMSRISVGGQHSAVVLQMGDVLVGDESCASTPTIAYPAPSRPRSCCFFSPCPTLSLLALPRSL